LTLAKGDKSINKYGIDSGVDAGYISRLLRGVVENAPSAMIIKKLADVASNGVGVQDLLVAAGYLDLLSGETNDEHNYLSKSEQFQQWEKVIEEAARYNISPEEALDFISSLGKSIARIRRNEF